MAVGNLNTGAGIPPTIIDAKGDLLVGTADNVVNRLGVTGTTGAVLTADAGETTGLKWAAAGSVGGLVHIKTETFSGAVSHSFGSDAAPIFTSDYANYKILLDNLLVASSTSVVTLRVRANTTDLTGSVYNFQIGEFTGSTTTAVRTLNSTSQRIAAAASTANEGSSCVIEIFTPQEAKPTLIHAANMFLLSGTGPLNIDTKGYVLNTTQYNGFTIIASSNFSGRMSVYGYKK